MAEDDLSHLSPEDRRSYLGQLELFQSKLAQLREGIRARGYKDFADVCELNGTEMAIEMLRDEYGLPRGTVH
jgi:hypothetical protein